ncbi:MAG: hypothetical protein ABI208_00105 [Ginsengibacter sp.]
MRINLIFDLLMFITTFTISAQKNKIKFQSINQFAVIGGESKIATAFQTVNGIECSNFLLGVGIGVDNYRYRTFPLFLDGRWNFGEEKRGFIYGDIGYNFPMKNKPGKEIYYYDSYQFTGSIYTDIGIGFQVPLYKRSSFLISGGYCYKKLQSKIGVTACPFIGPCYVDYSKYDFSFNRIVLKAGFVF